MIDERPAARALRLVGLLESGFRGPSWHGPAVLEVLGGVPAELAKAHPVAGAHSIGELVRHIGAWKRLVAAWARGEPRREIGSEVDWPAGCGTSWAAQLAQLEAAHEALIGAVAWLGEDDLGRRVGESDLETAIAGVVHHDLYHAGQIALLRRALDVAQPA